MNFKIYTLLFISLFLYSSCGCDCNNTELNSIYFAFKTGTAANSFPSEEIDTVTIFKLTKNTTIKIDSIKIYNKQFSFSETGSNFGGSFWMNDYLIKTQGTKEFLISEILIEAAESKDRCKCFENTVKKLKVNNDNYDFSGKFWNECNIELTK